MGQVLAPVLRPGQVVVADNLAAHHGRRVRELVEAAGAELVFLPAYSPDLSPIEEADVRQRARGDEDERARQGRGYRKAGSDRRCGHGRTFAGGAAKANDRRGVRIA